MSEISPLRSLERHGDAFLACLSFFTRLPAPRRDAPLDWARQAWAAPLAGALIGAFGALALLIANALGLPALLAAALSLAALIATTGAMHEDGLADIADGFGGGATKELKLAIMRDSRIGAFGAAALMLCVLARAAAIAALLAHGLGFAAAGLILVSAVSRAGALMPLALLSPARRDGLGADAGRLPATMMAGAALVGFGFCIALGLASLGVFRAIGALAAALAAAAALCALAQRQIGGQTGDVAGAAQQVGEIAALCALLTGLGAA